ncbi:MAG: hypothetical protein U1G08_10155 [Verrucomicrobiota bacterium]
MGRGGHRAAALLRIRTLALVGVLAGSGCRRNDGGDPGVASTPAQAAGQLETAFSEAPAEYRKAALDASEALRAGDYNRAVGSLGVLRGSGNVTLQQGLAIHGSLVVLEGRLAASAERGDPQASAAYDLLRRLKQK